MLKKERKTLIDIYWITAFVSGLRLYLKLLRRNLCKTTIIIQATNSL